MKVWLNGELLDEADATISPRDRGLLLGDGVFETLRTYGGRLVTLEEHLERLEAGAGVLGIPVGELDARRPWWLVVVGLVLAGLAWRDLHMSQSASD